MRRMPLWRPALLLSGVAMMAGGPRHPSPSTELPFRESTALMLAHPDWAPAHLLILLSYVLLLGGVLLWRRDTDPSAGTGTWSRITIAAAGVACVEMAFHAAAMLDLDRLRAGEPTPILSTHLALTTIANPLLGLALAGLAVTGARLGRLGSRWIAWMAVVGGAAYGFAGVYVVLTRDQRISPLFAVGATLMAFWLMLAAVWPIRAAASRTGTAELVGA
jgi:hypothetical protein